MSFFLERTYIHTGTRNPTAGASGVRFQLELERFDDTAACSSPAPWREGSQAICPVPRRSGSAVAGHTVDGCEIRFSHHVETMVETMVRWYLQGNRIIPGFLGWCRISPIHSRRVVLSRVWPRAHGFKRGKGGGASGGGGSSRQRVL